MINYRIVISSMAFCILLSITGTASAGLGFPSLLGTSSNSSSDMTATANMQTKLITDFITGEKSVLSSQADMTKALGLSDQAAKLNAAIAALGTGATNKSIGDAIGVSESATDQISKMKLGTMKLSADAKATMTHAIPEYLLGVVALIKLKPDYSSFMSAAQKQVSSASIMDVTKVKDKLSVGMFVASNGPGYTESLGKTTSDLITYAKGNNISIPKDATSLLPGF